MKKIIAILSIIILALLTFGVNSYAASLDTINIETTKTVVRPGEEVKVTINFGQNLGAYTFDVAYDNNIFEYVSAEGGTPNGTTDKVRVVFHDSSGGSNPRTYMSVTFRAKAGITTSNPTEFKITGEGLASPDGHITFDDITVPITKNVTVEPEYVDYTLKLEHSGNIITEQENQMTLSYSSPMGRYYEHARLIAEATSTTGGTVRLLATDSSSLEHDIIQNGWGDDGGYKIGGKDVLQTLQVRGIFSRAGDYTITLKLIDRDNSDQIIAEGTFKFTAVEQTQTTPPVADGNNPGTTEPETTTPEENLPEQTTEEEIVPEAELEENVTETPTKLPKTGTNMYIPIVGILFVLIGASVYYNKRKK